MLLEIISQKIVHGDGEIDLKKYVIPVNGLLHAWFKNIDVILNNTVIASGDYSKLERLKYMSCHRKNYEILCLDYHKMF